MNPNTLDANRANSIVIVPEPIFSPINLKGESQVPFGPRPYKYSKPYTELLYVDVQVIPFSVIGPSVKASV